MAEGLFGSGAPLALSGTFSPLDRTARRHGQIACQVLSFAIMTHRPRPDTIIPASFDQLKGLVWNRDPRRPIPAADAFALYERNWRHVDVTAMTDWEKQLVDDLIERFGNGVMLV